MPPTFPIALTRAVPPSITACELTHLRRDPVNVARAVAQHRRYEEALVELGCTLQRLPAAPELPDSVFVEDAAVVLPTIAIVARPGAASRRPEVPAVAEALGRFRPLTAIEHPATLDGGDVLCVGKRIYVGRSARTNAAGIQRLREIVEPLGYELRALEVTGCLHLKSAVTEVAEGTVLLNPEWVERSAFDGLETIPVHPGEPQAANALRIGNVLIHPAAHQRTRARLEERGVAVRAVEADELEKAEAGVTCCSIIVTFTA